jgi:HlyD family secretion protein
VTLALVGVGVFMTRGATVPVGRAIRTGIAQHFVASGRVRVATRVALTAETGGRVLEVTVNEGDRIRAGDRLLRLDDREARAAVAEARAALNQAAARVDQVQQVSAVVAGQAAREAAVALERAETELARVRTLAAAGAVAAATLEDAQRAVDVARAQRDAAEARDAATGREGADLSLAEAAVEQARAAVASAEARLARTRVTAPHDGQVLARAVERGDTIQTGAVLFELAADGVTELVIEPDERHLAWIRIGQEARASADAFPRDTFGARVSYIAPAVDPARGSVEVRLRVPDPPAYLRPDMTVSVDLEVASKADVIAVPSEAVREGDAEAFVFVVGDGRARRRPVSLGIRGEGHTEITRGLEEGTAVVLATPLALEDGDRLDPIDDED